MTRLRSIPLALVLLLALLASPPPATARGTVTIAPPDPVVVAHQVMAALGGQQRWDALPGLRWTFGVSSHDSVRFSRRHAWDRRTGRHRVEGTLPGGARFVFVHTLGDSVHGAAWLDGRAIRGDSLHAFIRQANAMWVNDSYWFLMPYKLLDPGVTLKPGGVVVLYGAQKAIDASLKIFGLLHANEDGGKVHHYICNEVVPPSYCDDVTMVVASWWRNSLSSICKFYDTLHPAVDSPSTMLLVDDLNAFLLVPDTQMAVAERKGRILTALRQWAVENAVVVVVGDPRDLELARSANYGGLVCAPVRFEKKNDAVRLIIGEDEIDVGDLKLEVE